MMQQSSVGGGAIAVDISKFESWPLLRPDELSSLPTEVLRASVADLDVMCRQASGEENQDLLRHSIHFGVNWLQLCTCRRKSTPHCTRRDLVTPQLQRTRFENEQKQPRLSEILST